MTDQPSSPFVPGARVAMQSRPSDYKEVFVDKVYKNGNFTLRGDKSRQQWRPTRYLGRQREDGTYEVRWSATPTGDYYYGRPTLEIWDATTDARISAAIAETKRIQRAHKVFDRLNAKPFKDWSDDFMDRLEALLDAREDPLRQAIKDVAATIQQAGENAA